MMFIAHTLITLRDKLATSDKERGATAVEYALVIALVSIVFVTALAVLNVDGLVDYINTFLTGAAEGGEGGA